MNIEGAESKALAGFRRGLLHTEHVAISCHDFLAEDRRGSASMRTKAHVRAVLENSGFTVRTRNHDDRPWIRDFVYGRRVALN